MDKRGDRKGLGRGLSALMADVNLTSGPVGDARTEKAAEPDALIAIDLIHPNPNQPRRAFNDDSLNELADSIRQKGVIQPILVRPKDGGASYEIVAGERRWRAAQIAQLHKIPAVIREMTEEEMIEIAIIENIQREDLSAIEEARGFRQLMDRFGHTQEKLAEALSKSRSHIANTLRLLTLPEDVQNMVSSGKLTAGHARALVGAEDALGLANKIVAQGLNVREVERLARAVSTKPNRSAGQASRNEKDADTKALEADISANLGMMVSIDHNGPDEGGTMRISYRTLEQLDMLCQVLSVVRRDFKN